MSKDFKTQDHHRYKKLGNRWRRPVGWQSKLRIRKKNAGRKVSIGYGSPKEGVLDEIIAVRNVADVVAANGRPIRIASTVGAKNVLAIAQKAKELDSRIVNMKKAKRAKKIGKMIADRKKKKKDEKKEAKDAKKDEKKETETKVKKKEETEEKKENKDNVQT